MKKILHVINGADLGGISSLIVNYYRNIDRNVIHFDFVYSDENAIGVNAKILSDLGAKFMYVPKKSLGLMKHCKGLHKVLKEGEYDAIHVHSNHTSYVALFVALICGVKNRIAHAHNAVKGWEGIRPFIERVVGIILINLFSTYRLACSEDAAVYVFGKHSLTRKNTIVLKNAIDINRFEYKEEEREKLREDYNISTQAFVYGTVGRMSSEKNHIYLLDVHQAVLKHNPAAILCLIGDGSERKELEHQVDARGIRESVIFLGNRSDVGALLNIFDVFVVPSKNEGFCIAGLEAGANGLPLVLSSAVPADLSFLNNVEVRTLEHNPDEWATAILNLNGKRSSNTEKIIKNGYSIKESASKLARVYLNENYR